MATKNYIKEFKSIAEFEKYLNETPLNSLFRWTSLESSAKDESWGGWHGTRTYEDAIELLKHGWQDMSKKLETKLKLIANEIMPKTVRRSKYDVAGFQVSVPRTLQGIPTNMINQKNVVQKQKVITIVKHIGYPSNVKPEEIIESSIKALQIVKKIEAQGYRVNLCIMDPCGYDDEVLMGKVRIKSADERLNISKIAFPLVHPSMLRRLYFRYIEVNPDIKNKGWIFGYGRPVMDRNVAKSFLNKGEYYLHNIITDVDEEIKLMNLK